MPVLSLITRRLYCRVCLLIFCLESLSSVFLRSSSMPTASPYLCAYPSRPFGSMVNFTPSRLPPSPSGTTKVLLISQPPLSLALPSLFASVAEPGNDLKPQINAASNPNIPYKFLTARINTRSVLISPPIGALIKF